MSARPSRSPIAHPDAVAMQRREIVANKPPKQAEQVADSVAGRDQF
jgi:hypothetical protein